MGTRSSISNTRDLLPLKEKTPNKSPLPLKTPNKVQEEHLHIGVGEERRGPLGLGARVQGREDRRPDATDHVSADHISTEHMSADHVSADHVSTEHVSADMRALTT